MSELLDSILALEVIKEKEDEREQAKEMQKLMAMQREMAGANGQRNA